MNFKEELKSLVELVQSKAKNENRRLRKEDIADRLKLERSYFSSLLGKRGVVTEDHIELFKIKFKEELEPSGPGSKTSAELVQAASIKVLIEEVAKLKAKLFQQSFEEALKDIQDSTTAIIEGILINSEEKNK